MIRLTYINTVCTLPRSFEVQSVGCHWPRAGFGRQKVADVLLPLPISPLTASSPQFSPMITSVILENPPVTADITSKSLRSCPQVRPSLYRHHRRSVHKLLLSSPTRPFFTKPTSSQIVCKLLLSSSQIRSSLYRHHHRSVRKLLLSSPQIRPSLYRHHRNCLCYPQYPSVTILTSSQISR